MVSTEVKNFTAFGKYDENMKETEDMTLILASDNIASSEYYADFTHADERMLDNIQKFLPAKLRH